MKMKKIELTIPEDTVVATITIMSSTRPDGNTLIKVDAFVPNTKKHEIKWDEEGNA